MTLNQVLCVRYEEDIFPLQEFSIIKGLIPLLLVLLSSEATFFLLHDVSEGISFRSATYHFQ